MIKYIILSKPDMLIYTQEFARAYFQTQVDLKKPEISVLMLYTLLFFFLIQYAI